MLKIAHEQLKLEGEKSIAEFKQRSKGEIASLIEENHRLQLEVDEQRELEEQRRLKREVDDLKRRLSESQNEVSELRRERDQIKMHRNDLMVTQAKEVDEERCAKRQLAAECDKLKLKVKIMEEESHKLNLRAERKT